MLAVCFRAVYFSHPKKMLRIFNLVITTFSKIVSKDAILPTAILASHPITMTLNIFRTSEKLQVPPKFVCQGPSFCRWQKLFLLQSFPPWKVERTLRRTENIPKPKVGKGSSFNFQPSFFMGELFNFGRVNFSIYREPLHLRKVLAVLFFLSAWRKCSSKRFYGVG